MHFLSFYTIKTIEITDESCEITWRPDVTSRKPYKITSCRVLRQTIQCVVLLHTF